MVITLKPIIPKQQFKPADLDRAINDALSKTLKVGEGYFKTTTKSWSTDVKFVIDGPEDGRGSVGTDNDIYGYVTHGTPPHLIAPVNASILAFPGNSSPKTNPGILGSRKGKSGGGAVFAHVVHHPGTKARGFEEAVAKRLLSVLVNNVTAAILRVVG